MTDEKKCFGCSENYHHTCLNESTREDSGVEIEKLSESSSEVLGVQSLNQDVSTEGEKREITSICLNSSFEDSGVEIKKSSENSNEILKVQSLNQDVSMEGEKNEITSKCLDSSFEDSGVEIKKSSESSNEVLEVQLLNQDVSIEDNLTVNNISENENNILENENNIPENENNILENENNISGNENNITENENNIAENESDPAEQNNQEYIYDERYKMYYSVSTGYYYDRNRDLFFIPQEGAYYKYDYYNHKYELYEQCENYIKPNNSDTEDESQDANFEVPQPNLVEQCDNSRENNEDLEREYETSLKASGFESKVTCEPTNDWQTPEGSNVTVQDLVREVAEQNCGMSEYIYDEKYAMYRSKSTGFLYDQINKLLFDPIRYIYYTYNEERSSFDFYCSVDSLKGESPCKHFPDNLFSKNPFNNKLLCKKNYLRSKLDETLNKNQNEMEKDCEEESVKNGETPLENNVNCEENVSSPESGEIFSSDSEALSPQGTDVTEDSTVCLPCIRAIVENSTKLKIGSLILITCTGGKMGRDKMNAVYIPDIGVSKEHAEVKFSAESGKYCIQDLGSQNGTFINELRLSQEKQKSELHDLTHGDTLTLGSCKMLLHIHEGYETCDKCEPGQVMAELSSQAKVLPVLKTKQEKEKERRTHLNIMKKKYGLKGKDYESEKSSAKSGYEDKAEIRRKTVGSQNPYEKTEMSSMNETMSKSNKGYQMLRKLGWNEGEPLGASRSGISEPIPIRPWVSKAGLGSASAETSACTPVQVDKRKLKWVKAQERYFQLPDVSLQSEET